MIVEANAQTSRKLLTTAGNELSPPYTHVWFVRPKLSRIGVSNQPVVNVLECSPVDTLGESGTECVGASAFEDVDKSTWVEDYLVEKPVSARSPADGSLFLPHLP